MLAFVIIIIVLLVIVPLAWALLFSIIEDIWSWLFMPDPHAPNEVTSVSEVKDIYHACSIIEGFDLMKHSKKEKIIALQYLIDTGDAYELQGFYGRMADEMIKKGICHARASEPRDAK